MQELRNIRKFLPSCFPYSMAHLQPFQEPNMWTKRNAMTFAPILILWNLVSPAVFAQEKPTVTSEEALQRLKKGNEKFVADPSASPKITEERRQEVAKVQRPFAIILTCADSRVTPEY